MGMDKKGKNEGIKVMRNVLKKIFLILPVAVVLYGCAGAPLPDVVWPEPPEEPRVKYVRSYGGQADFKKSNIAADILLGAGASATLVKPMGVHVSKEGKIYVTDTAVADIQVWDPENKKATTFAAKGAKEFYKPISVATDKEGRIFVTDSQGDRVVVFDKDYKIESYLEPEEPFKQPSGIAANEATNRLYVTDTHKHDITVFELDSLKYLKTIGKRGSEEGEFNFPSHITTDHDGNLYVVDTMNARVQIFDPDGNFLSAFGQFGDAPGMFARPKGIAVDSEGHIYVVDAAFNNVQIFDREGQVLLAFAGFGGGRGELILPAGMAIDDKDFIYVVDQWNERVQVFEYLGEKHRAREAAAEGEGKKKKKK